MNIILGIEYIIIAGWLMFLAWLAINALMTRISPKWAAKRKLREKRRSDHASAKRQQKRVAKAKRDNKKAERERQWAEAHPDDPAAQLILAPEASPAPLVEATPLTEEEDFLAELRRKQKADDDYKRRREAEKLAEEMRTQQMLDWAIEHPDIPEARRHLEEQLTALTKEFSYTDSDVRHCETMMSYNKEDDPESILYATRLSEARAKKEVEAERIRRIQAALEMPLPESSEQ